MRHYESGNLIFGATGLVIYEDKFIVIRYKSGIYFCNDYY